MTLVATANIAADAEAVATIASLGIAVTVTDAGAEATLKAVAVR